MNMPIITLTYGSILGLILLILSVAVVRGRTKQKVLIGEGTAGELTGLIRAHANFSEYVPLTLIILAMVEMAGGESILVRFLGGGLILARVLHAWELARSTGTSFGRAGGTMLTWLVLLGASGYGLYLALA